MNMMLRLLKYLRPSRKWVVISVLLLVFGTIVDLTAPWLLKEVFDKGIADKNVKMVLGFTLALAGIQVAKSIAMFVQGRSQELVGQNVIFKLREEMYAHLQRLSFSYYDKAQTGQLMSRMTGDIESVKNFIGFGAMAMFTGALTFVGTIGFMLFMNWQVTLLSMATIPLLMYAVFRFNKKVGPAWGQVREQMGKLTTTLQENISGIRVVKAFARETVEQRKFEARNEDNFATNMDRAKMEAAAFPLMNFYGGIVFVTMVWFGALYVANDKMSFGTFMAFQWYTWGIIWPLNMLGWQINIMQQAMKAAPRVFEVLDTPVDIAADAGGSRDVKRIEGNVEFNDVAFHFADQDPDKEAGVLEDISLSVRQGEVIAVLGATGSGKSSLIALMSRFYDVSRGALLIDGVDVKDYELEGLRRKIGIVPQETFLFSATIRENIAYGVPEATQEQIEWAASKAQIHSFIEGMPFGYDTLIGERGVGLSGGQRQRVALARAILMDPPILVLDEATASVDTATESAIHEELLEVMKGRTTFIIAQRLSSVKRADRIVVLDRGRIVQQGTHRELFAQEGFFRSLFQMQEAAASR
ncbi:ABC transporter ATP-binding protein [Paenibacillus sacheonensis]|uniref:ATP-binding cassette domain-containing protein n=1 Tax=Paenibacillus sacheonensis TaxID=742054 RepID=A0A7X4YKU1_9BACL|nr:ABC transporter ATP-binding protein [Paenibacillus sacheonensis]MBM7563315.1 ATP-binding cassette subfamily B protein [Paenibacillus sacheonensis]NBC68127.1 ATP-binding cassette domain-containing protein [Paenibacillus sacheonensis]